MIDYQQGKAVRVITTDDLALRNYELRLADLRQQSAANPVTAKILEDAVEELKAKIAKRRRELGVSTR